MHHEFYLQNSCPRNMVCFRYVILNTLHKGDDNDDDNDDNDDDIIIIVI
jgi:hypothetical protein